MTQGSSPWRASPWPWPSLRHACLPSAKAGAHQGPAAGQGRGCPRIRGSFQESQACEKPRGSHPFPSDLHSFFPSRRHYPKQSFTMVADTPENLRLKQQSELQSQVRGRGGPVAWQGGRAVVSPGFGKGSFPLPSVVTQRGQGAEILALAFSPCPHPPLCLVTSYFLTLSKEWRKWVREVWVSDSAPGISCRASEAHLQEAVPFSPLTPTLKGGDSPLQAHASLRSAHPLWPCLRSSSTPQKAGCQGGLALGACPAFVSLGLIFWSSCFAGSGVSRRWVPAPGSTRSLGDSEE